jgi:hypothetical protein
LGMAGAVPEPSGFVPILCVCGFFVLGAGPRVRKNRKSDVK